MVKKKFIIKSINLYSFPYFLDFIKGYSTLESLSISTYIRFSSNDYDISDYINPLLEKSIDKLLKLSISGAYGNDISEHECRKIINNCPNLEYLRLSNSSIKDNGLTVILKGLSKLKHLDLRDNHCYFYGDSFYDLIFLNIEILNISNTEVHSNFIDKIPLSFPNLKELIIDASFQYDMFLIDNELEFLSMSLKYLKKLNISCNYEITDNGIKSLYKNCKDLEYLIIDGCNNITDISIYGLASSCKNIKYIDCSRCYSITKKCIDDIIKTYNIEIKI